MFSGKTEELIRRLKRAEIANQEVKVFKPARDLRYDDEKVVSHDENALFSTPLESSEGLLAIDESIEVIGIDEAQFFDQGLTMICQSLALKGVRIIVAGLDMDYLGEPFGPMPDLLAVAEYITKVHAICPHCGNLATHSYRIVAEQSQILLGASDTYEPRCRMCYQMGNILDLRINKSEGTQ
jgi:thymidine kinase